jgi:poly(ADP-ribose) glycohydrolase
VAALLLGALQEPHAGFPGLDTDALWGAEAPQEVAKLRAMLALFEGEPDGRGALTVRRQVAPARTAAQWADDAAPLTALTVATAGGIEDAAGHLQVDFANRFLGGGVLSGGCVQEEIRFAVSPELLVGLLVSPRMLDGEAVVLHGAAQVARTRGYASGLRYDGAHRDPVARLADGTPDVTVVAIDALDFRKHPAGLEATEPALLRELQKAHAGFWPDERRLPIATGNWGCGVFGGDPALKAMLQWMAASTAGRAVRYYPYGDARVAGLDALADDLRGRGVTVGGLWRRLRASLPRPDGLFAALRAGG